MTGGEGLEPGLYDELVSLELADRLDGREAETRKLDDAEQPHRLARHLERIVESELLGLDASDRLAVIEEFVARVGRPETRIVDPPTVLDGIPTIGPLGDAALPTRPDIPLSQHDLLVNARGEPHLAAELKKEIASADRIDIIVAFVRWYGVRLLIEPLEEALRRNIPIRLLTTTYTGSTERVALDRLAELGVDVAVSYDTAITRLHAKAWLFHRKTGFSTAYIGSSNLTRSALLDGREWNVRVSADASPALFAKVSSAFDAHWASHDFEAYDPTRDHERLDRALNPVERTDDDQLSGLTLEPWPYQREILEALDPERQIHGSHRNLVVAPTGTGKTVVAALDYRRLLRQEGSDLSLLFVAHRETLLTQSRRTFREALSDGSFGELYVGGHRPDDGRHVFASIQTLHANDPRTLDPTAFDVVIVDEFHHAEAQTYRALLDHLKPKYLLALTATPERADGLDVRRWTDNRTAFDMRLWHALDRQLLAPFQYFGVADTADLSSVRWQAGRYSAADLGDLYTGDDIRAALVLKQLDRVIAQPRAMKALGFCASVEHAQYMARYFTDRGLPAVAVWGDTAEADRTSAIDLLRRGELCCIFSRDVFNEGVDIPEADTILLLRPTESVTVFLQQLGRGLRRHHDKDVCTILDFVANYRREFRFDLRLRALTGIARRGLLEAAEEGFPYLPSGCHIELERQAREWVLGHLKESIRTNRRVLANELRVMTTQLGDGEQPTLASFLHETGVELEDVAKAGGWTKLRREAGLETGPPTDAEPTLARGIGRITHLDDVERIDTWTEWLSHDHPPQLHTERERRLAWMLLVSAWSLKAAPDSFDEAIAGLWRSEPLLDELRQTLPILRDRISRVPLPLPDPNVPLQIGASYARDEILSAFGRLTPGERYSHQAGPWWHEPDQTEVLFITLRKTAKEYSPQTMYRDFAISPDLFHWESQHSTRVASPSGQRYINQRTNGVRILLAIREAKKDPWANTAPYVLLGPADYASHEGERPIALTWRLRNPIPAEIYERFKVAAA